MIIARSAPRASIIQQEHSMEECGFKLLFSFIKGLSPHLGGEFRDLQNYLSSLKINDGEPVLEFYLRALEMSVFRGVSSVLKYATCESLITDGIGLVDFGKVILFG